MNNPAVSLNNCSYPIFDTTIKFLYTFTGKFFHSYLRFCISFALHPWDF